jgi:hypothetical protein
VYYASYFKLYFHIIAVLLHLLAPKGISLLILFVFHVILGFRGSDCEHTAFWDGTQYSLPNLSGMSQA